ncbi:pyridoxal-dependent decarboxylase, exosortase A system-associated [Sphingomonas colocasiae]|uniref:Pyridoxal-dependent decarboxylase, exosortase A system-associated n=1 Tax=Sphingomonas colocasiae TaxID=1848973 RepID=A0ABS7PJ52_9SPHN|nr:pyridoxal-dependent decarboxylase, exosortase A system-associated [Sphingomonas colocasiae]MBY8821283.1 pyridoxal-dependent decarboxylase, exosortase A system-associated [Sphingomonas colocasiae]
MKPMGQVPADLTGEDGELLIAGRRVTDIVEQAGSTPLFVYDLGIVRRRFDALRAAMPPALSLHYAMKANPYPPLLAAMTGIVDGIDVASVGEMRLALSAGAVAGHMSFAGPGKRDEEIEAAIGAGVTLNCESEGEAERAFAIGDRIGAPPRLAVRVNPDFELKGSGMRMGGRPTAFGIDAARVPALVRRIADRGAQWRGFHIYSGSQALDPEALIETQAATVALAARLAEEAGMPPPHVNLGGGFGIPYFPNEVPLDIGRIGAALAETLELRPAALANTDFAIELGRWLVGECGVYLARVIDRKQSHGETFLVTDGGLHHQLAASGNFGTVVRRNYPLAVATRFGAEVEESATVVGCLCTPLDVLGNQTGLPRADVGDIIAVFMAGAYGASASPSGFLGHGPAREILLGN